MPLQPDVTTEVRTLHDVCADLWNEMQRIGLVITNRVTGKTIASPEDIFNFSSHGELFHIWEWWDWLLPNVDLWTGKPKETP